MADVVVEQHGVPVLVCDAEGARIATEQDALDHLIGSAFQNPDVVAVAVPTARFDDRFFDLSTGLAGAIMQKFVTYRLRLVIVGDLSPHLRSGTALRDLVREANRGPHVWFLPDLAALTARLALEAPHARG
ncbi:DUF4180 domain-containing protein [Streptomyces sp. NPDC046557]|uniref:DUF4180 domain-containing protein n=1 Tax=Streptomyces sp. NPDC046557 TaxID=3155372 RepID=UPI0033F96C32